MSWNERIDPIKQNIRAKESLIVALSGGVDSAVVAALAAAALGERALSVTVNSPLTGTTELEDARRSAEAIGINHMVIDLNELEIPGFATNPPERCYLCKRFRYQRLLALADELGYRAVADGTTTGDLEEYRPGRQAADELGIYYPLVEAGLTKTNIAELARHLGLPPAGKPHNSCLASRIPYGEELTPARLERIDGAENYLHTVLPDRQLRVRDHGDLARIEVDSDDRDRLLDSDVSPEIVAKLRAFGYRFVTIDLDGYRFGSYDN
jgi:uncharacterized protein